MSIDRENIEFNLGTDWVRIITKGLEGHHLLTIDGQTEKAEIWLYDSIDSVFIHRMVLPDPTRQYFWGDNTPYWNPGSDAGLVSAKRTDVCLYGTNYLVFPHATRCNGPLGPLDIEELFSIRLYEQSRHDRRRSGIENFTPVFASGVGSNFCEFYNRDEIADCIRCPICGSIDEGYQCDGNYHVEIDVVKFLVPLLRICPQYDTTMLYVGAEIVNEIRQNVFGDARRMMICRECNRFGFDVLKHRFKFALKKAKHFIREEQRWKKLKSAMHQIRKACEKGDLESLRSALEALKPLSSSPARCPH